MNPFIQSKIGEVLAFARIGADTLSKGNAGFVKILPPEELEKLSTQFTELEQKIAAFTAKEDVSQKVEAGAKETFDKVTDMRDTYIDGKWNDSSEVLEWMGFYTGASLVHWYLVEGAASSLKISDLESISKDAIDAYSSLFSADKKFLHGIGEKGSN